NVPRKAYARVAETAPRGSESVLDPRIDHLGKGGEMRADEGTGDGYDEENDDDLRNESQRHLLDLGQGLDQRDHGPDQHRRADRRAGSNDNGPDRLLDDVEGVPLVHGLAERKPGPDRDLRTILEGSNRTVAVDGNRHDL